MALATRQLIYEGTDEYERGILERFRLKNRAEGLEFMKDASDATKIRIQRSYEDSLPPPRLRMPPVPVLSNLERSRLMKPFADKAVNLPPPPGPSGQFETTSQKMRRLGLPAGEGETYMVRLEMLQRQLREMRAGNRAVYVFI